MRTIAVALALASVACASDVDAFLKAQAERYWKDRDATVAAVKTPAQLRARQEYIRRALADAMGGFPNRNPLNARVTGGFSRDGYRVEHVVFESQPKYFVTANIYVPTRGNPPFPAVIGASGHTNTGKADPTYQRAWIGMATRGFLVVAFDPPGQGERSEYAEVPVGTAQHNLAGAQCLLTGSTFAAYETWDGIRALDYALSRPDVDPKRVAVAGNSGGGTQSSYLAAVDPRFAAAVVSCYITDWRDLWDKPGPQDAEQNLPGFVQAGLNFGDFILSIAPKPFLIEAATRDFFPIAGTHRTFDEVKGLAPATELFEYDDVHGWNKPQREAAYRFLSKHLLGRDDDGVEREITPESVETLNVTKTGQVRTALGGETVHTLNLQFAESLAKSRRATPDIRASIERLLNLPPRRAGPSVAAGVLETEPGVRVAAKIHAPLASGLRPAVIYINSKGLQAGAGRIASLAKEGNLVFGVEPRGWGDNRTEADMWALSQRAMLIGRPLIGMQVYDVLRAFDFLMQMSNPLNIDRSKISVYGDGDGGIVALLAAGAERRIASVTSDGAPESYMAAVRAEAPKGLIGIVIPGVLRQFDLPDVAAAIAPRPVRILNPRK